MEDISKYIREGNTIQVKLWLGDTEHDPNEGDDHGFTPLHWAAMFGQPAIVELLLQRGAKATVTNMGDDTPLHLAATRGHRPIVQQLIRYKADVNFVNEHGNTPLHYACFWSYQYVGEDLVNAGALVTIANRFDKMPLDYCKGSMAQKLHDLALETGQQLHKIEYRDQSWLAAKTRSRDPTLSRHKGINIEQLNLAERIAATAGGETWHGRWQGSAVVAKLLAVRRCTRRVCYDFGDQYPRLRIFSHANVEPLLGACTAPPRLVLVSRYMRHGSLYDVLHRGQSDTLIDATRALQFALDTARGMQFLHTFDKNVPNYALNSHHVLIDDDMTAKINMADAQFTFQNKGKIYYPQWYAPEALVKNPSTINRQSADMWSLGVLLFELVTRDVPFQQCSPMEAGLKISTEGMRLVIPPGVSARVARLIAICMNEDPSKRPQFARVTPILEQMISK